MQTTLTQVLERLASVITEVAVARHDLPFHEAEWHFALGTTNVERGVFIRIRDAAGNEGLGYAAEVKHDGETIDSLVGALKLLAADLVGHPPYPFTSHLDRWDRLLYRNRRAKAGLEFALLDLAGRALGVPCRLFLGASSGSTSVDVMRILQLQAPEAMAETARQLVREGYRYLKIKVGGDLATDIERVRAVRAAVGSEVGLIVDANQAFTPKEAISFGRAVASADIDIFEQPVARKDVQGLREVRRALDCWIEADESAATSQDVANLAAADAIDCVSIKLPKMGGLLRSIAVAQTCQALGLAYRIGASFGSRLYAAANMQFIAAMPVDYACEVGEFMHLANDPVADIEVRDGRLALPDGPGLGVRLRPDTQLDWQVIPRRRGEMRGCAWKAPLFRPLLLALLLVGSGACTLAPAKPTPPAETAAPGAMAVAAGPIPAPLEKDTLHVAVAATGSAYTPLQVAIEAGYFRNHGLTVNTSVMAASVAAQALVSGSIDMYQGGAAAIAARLGGSDIIYIAAAVDRSTLVLFGEKGLTQFTDFRGKTIATTSVGAFGEIALHQTAKEYGMVPGQDFALLYHPGPEAALASFLAGAAQGVIITPPQTLEAAERGYPVIIDYYQKGLRIIGPGMAVTRAFAREHPNTLKAYLKGYLDGVKRAYDDPEYAMAVNAKYTRVDDPKLRTLDYEIGTRTWNKDLTVNRSAIEVVLQNSPLPNAKEANPDDFYDNSLINEVNATYAAQLFPEVFAGRQSR